MHRFLIVIGILLAAALALYGISTPEAAMKREPLDQFPRVLGDWKTIGEQSISKSSQDMLKVDDYIVRTYANSRGEQIGLYIGYFTSQKEGKGIHSPRQCLPGSGLVQIESSSIPLKVFDRDPGTIEVDRYLMAKGGRQELFIFWYHGRGRSYASEYMNKVYLIWDGLTKHRTDGALVRVDNLVSTTPAEALETQTAFIRLMVPILSNYIPE